MLKIFRPVLLMCVGVCLWATDAHAQGVLPQDAAYDVVEDEITGTFLGYEDLSIAQQIRHGTLDWRGVTLILLYLVDFITKFAGTMGVIFLIYSGFRLMIGGLSSDGEAAAAKHMANVVIGLILTFLAWVIVNFIIVTMTA